MLIICYNIFDRFSLSVLRLQEMFKIVKQKNTEAMISTDTDEIYNVINNFFPEYRIYKSTRDSRYHLLIQTMLQKYSDLIFCPSFKEVEFLGDLQNKIQFCLTDKINVIVVDGIVTIIPKYIFEISLVYQGPGPLSPRPGSGPGPSAGPGPLSPRPGSGPLSPRPGSGPGPSVGPGPLSPRPGSGPGPSSGPTPRHGSGSTPRPTSNEDSIYNNTNLRSTDCNGDITFELFSPRNIENDGLATVSYKIYKLNDGSDARVRVTEKEELSKRLDLIEYEEIHNCETEKEMFNKVHMIMADGCLPIRHNRLISDIFGQIECIKAYRVMEYKFPYSNINKFLNTEYKKSLIDTYYNQKCLILPYNLNRRNTPLTSTLSKISKITVLNLARETRE